MKQLKQPTVADVSFEIRAEFDEMPVRGAFASGDDELDKADEDAILKRLDRGDVWAWAVVTVVGTFEGFEACNSLGGCTYENEADFHQQGYLEDMKAEVLQDLQDQVAAAVVTTAGEVFKDSDTQQLASLIEKRFGHDMEAAAAAYSRLLGSTVGAGQFKGLVFNGREVKS